jgi:predicted TIM-barrel enzyme
MMRLEVCTHWQGRDLRCCLYLPGLRGLEGGDLDLLAMLPVCDVNGDLARSLTSGDLWTVPGPAPVAGLFMLDPFLRISEMVSALKAAGIQRVANYPTIQVLEGETARGLASVGLAPAQEFEVLREFGRQGFSMVGFATGAAAARELAASGASTVVLHPGAGAGRGDREAVATMSVWLKPELSARGTTLLAFSPREGVARAV